MTTPLFCAISLLMTTKISQKRVNKHGDTRGLHPNSQKNLKPFEIGHPLIGNTDGFSLRAELKHALVKEKRMAIVNSTIEGAILREPTPFKELWDRVDGKLQGDQPPVQNINVVFVIGRGYRDLPQLVESNK